MSSACFSLNACIFDGESGGFVRAFGRFGRKEDGRFDHPCAIAADALDHIIVLDWTRRLQVFEADGTHICTRGDLGIYASRIQGSDSNNKGVAWCDADGRDRLLIANGAGNDALIFDAYQ